MILSRSATSPSSEVCPNVVSLAALANGLQRPLCLATQRSAGITGDALSAELPPLRSREEAARPAAFSAGVSVMLLGRRPEGFGTGPAADLSIGCGPRPSQRKEYTFFRRDGPYGGGDRPTLGPKKILCFQVIALAAGCPRSTKNLSPYSTG
ncbi:hypothetical protein MPLA_770076 [Mesorhizobium sp. ORS 3359]|nr:hypothetical protein MPLA_770076 [Mesorhizobium sp. ORS 3359]